jgi:hypothetical protein
MKIAKPKKISMEALGSDAPEWAKVIVEAYITLEPLTQALQNQLTFADNLKASIKTVTVLVPEPTWTAPTLVNSWADIGGADLPTGYRMEPGGWVTLRGRVGGGTVANSFFYLPTGYIPAQHYHIINLSEDGGGNRCPYHMNISTNGQVTPYQVGAAFYNNYVVINARYQATTPAAPTAFTGRDWPIVLKTGFTGKVQSVQLLGAEDMATSQTTTVSSMSLDWRDDGNGSVRILSAYGLQPQRTYKMSFLILGE